MIYYIDYIPEELSFDINKLIPEKRIVKAESYHNASDGLLCKLAYLLFLYGLEKEYGVPMDSQIYWDINKKGKPYLSGYPHINFNISHCINTVLCGFSNSSIGVDVQNYISDISGLPQVVCSFSERERIEKADDPNKLFTWFWCLKEAYLKQKGTGLTDEINTLDFSDFDGDNFEKYGLKFTVFEMNGCCFAVCGEEFFDSKDFYRLNLQ